MVDGCQAVNASGESCDAPDRLVEDGYCHAHRPGGAEFMRDIASLGGRATAAKHSSAGFTDADLQPIRTVEDAQRRLELISNASLTRRITHNECGAASRAIAEWVRAVDVAQTERLSTELHAELARVKAENDSLRAKLSAAGIR